MGRIAALASNVDSGDSPIAQVKLTSDPKSNSKYFFRKLNISSTSLLVSLLFLASFSSSLLLFLVIIGLKLLSFSLVRLDLKTWGSSDLQMSHRERPFTPNDPLFRYHRRKCSRRSPRHCHRLFDLDCQTNGKEKLLGQEFGSRRNFGINFNNLLRQNWYPYSGNDFIMTSSQLLIFVI